jgi:hypothetical protein
MRNVMLMLMLASGFFLYVHYGNGYNSDDVKEPKITDKERVAYNQSKPPEWNYPVTDYTKADPADALMNKNEPDTFEHYSPETLANIKAMMGGGTPSSTSTSSSSQDKLNSGDANYTASSDDSSVGSVQNDSGTTVTVVPVGYHLVKTYTTKKGTVVKQHIVKNKKTKKKSTTKSKDLSTKTTTRSHDIAQRSLISKQNFPGASISSSDPTIIIGTH